MTLWLASVVGVCFISLQPRVEMPVDFWQADKVYHLLAYGWLGLLPFGAFFNLAQARTAALAMIPLGIVLELAQAFIPGRFASWIDLVANVLGVLLALAAARLIRRCLCAHS